MLQKEDLGKIWNWLEARKLCLQHDLTELSKQIQSGRNLIPEINEIAATSKLINQYAQIPSVEFSRQRQVEWTESQRSWFMIDLNIFWLRREFELKQIKTDELKRQLEYKEKQFDELEKAIEFVKTQLNSLTNESI